MKSPTLKIQQKESNNKTRLLSYLLLFVLALGYNVTVSAQTTVRDHRTGETYIDIRGCPIATQDEINEFQNIKLNQMGVGVLGGDTTKPIYYHDGEHVWKYEKNTELGNIDAWFPVDEFRPVLCGKVTSYHLCGQDFWHDGSMGNLDIDGNLDIMPNPKFAFMSKNPRLETYIANRYLTLMMAMGRQLNPYASDQEISAGAAKAVTAYRKKWCQDRIECEIEPYMPKVKIPATYNQPESYVVRNKTPTNPLFHYSQDGGLKKRENKDICVYGPWMWDRRVEKAYAGDWHNNEIHPINQIWFKEGHETVLVSIVDGSGHFDIRKNGEVEASGLNQKMRYYIAFEIPLSTLDAQDNKCREYNVSSQGYDWLKSGSPGAAQPKDIPLKYKGKTRLMVHDNSFLRFQETHSVTFEKIRARHGAIQGYIVVETFAITKPGGSINTFVEEVVH